MKKLLITIVAAFSALNIYAQEYDESVSSPPPTTDTVVAPVKPLEANIRAEHMLFRGEQITGSLDRFVEKMERRGFKYLIPEPTGATMYGRFAAIDDCHLVIETNNNIVYRASVVFPRRKVWREVHGDFEYLKEMLVKKYGEPADSVIDFKTHEPKDDYSKLMKVRQDLCEYYIQFDLPRGTIKLSIGHIEPSPVKRFLPCVVLAYEDKINAQKEVTKAYDDL